MCVPITYAGRCQAMTLYLAEVSMPLQVHVTMGDARMLSAALTAVLASCMFSAMVRLVWRPRAISRRLRRQGVRGPGYRFLAGNLGDIKRLRDAGAGIVLDVASHDFIPINQPQFRQWIPLYGRVFLYWFGSTPNICVADFNMAKLVLSDRTGLFPKNGMNPIVRLVGKGLVMTNGDEWQRHKKVVHPAFNVDKLKMMAVTMVDCVRSMVSRWEEQLARQGKKGFQVEIEMSKQIEELTADVISRTAFGSSYREGRQVFQALNELQFIAFSTLYNVSIPGFRYLPTEKNRKTWRLSKKIRSTLVQIIENRIAAKDIAGYGDDLLGLMLEACGAPERGEKNQLLSMEEIIDECKTFFFAGQETSANLLCWTMFLLGTHPEWQEKLREEVLRECGKDQVPTHDMLNKLKLVNLFILETLRLYSPVPLIRRRTASEVKLGSITVPEGAVVTIPIATMHRDKEVWGADADEFNPLRFDNSAGAARLLSFSMGPRTCIGQNFAMVEAKAEVAVILQRFALSLSPRYVHAPTDVITLRPKHGLPMIVRSVDV